MAASIRTKPGRTSPADGGCGFVYDPDVPAAHEPVFWLPEHSPGTLILTSAPPGFDPGVAFDPAALGTVLAEREDASGRELIIRDTTGDVHIWLLDEGAARHPSVVLPRDGALKLRLDLASRFLRRLLGQRVGLLPPKLRLTDFQRHRYIQLLRAADLYEEGGEPRDVAAQILRSRQAELPAIEFKDSAARKQADRLIKQSLALVNRGYLKLLRGG
ncbi:DUF2285 domain-containing protein [Telmatospirillum sp.]|uniref:DUF2285 domain-containing protein n=1 Tax=Telmatospirillum sp. TaxID=2079197 RepID=UPI00283C8739|nr:DUF2285 domain-containing protein [Telmatospirillum sp.]MDR3436634.1 DUF2285 domain-containing protein [Telmatospirillum sp.]